jgi:hypothetical protein
LKSDNVSAVGSASVVKAVPTLSSSTNPAPVASQQGVEKKSLLPAMLLTNSSSLVEIENAWLPFLSSTTAFSVYAL